MRVHVVTFLTLFPVTAALQTDISFPLEMFKSAESSLSIRLSASSEKGETSICLSINLSTPSVEQIKCIQDTCSAPPKIAQ